VTEGEELAAAVANLRAVTANLHDEVLGLRRMGRQNRWAIIAMLLGGLCVLVLALYIRVTADRAATASSEARQADVSQSVTCQVLNRTRAQVIVVWEDLIKDEPQATATPADRAGSAEFLTLVRQVYAPISCLSVGR
jgi:hypothetical protein